MQTGQGASARAPAPTRRGKDSKRATSRQRTPLTPSPPAPKGGAWRAVLVALLLLCAATVAVELWRPVGAEPGSDRPEVLDFHGSFALYGFVGCVLLVLLGRILRRIVMRPADYWRNA